jgi:hypothetical protein
MTDARKPPPIPGRLLDLIEEMIESVDTARNVPLSTNAMINREEMLTKLQRMKAELPEELRAARWMVREREAYIARTNEKAREVIERARAKAEEMVAESHIVEEAVAEANSLVRNAEAEARRIRLEAEDHAEQRLAELETLFGELLNEVRDARVEFHESRPAPPEPPVSD